MATSTTLPLARGLTIGGAALILFVGLAGASILGALAASSDLRAFYHDNVDPNAQAILPAAAWVLAGLVLAWTLLTGGVALWAGVAMRERSPHVMTWGVVAIVAAIASMPVTGGLCLGALLAGAGGILAISASRGPSATRPPPGRAA